MNIKLYSSPTCPRCRVLGMKMDAKGIKFEKIENEDVLIEKGFKSIPWLEVNGELFDFTAANEWINKAEVK